MEKLDMSIKAWSEQDRPREKLLIKGKNSLSDAELLAVLIRSGTPDSNAVDIAKLILKQNDNNLNKLAQCSISELKKIKGIGLAKAVSIISALELGRRRKATPGINYDSVESSRDAYHVMQPYLLDLPHEEFWILLLNRSNSVIGKVCISKGGISNTSVDPKIIFKEALEARASAIILLHNHPSGNKQPSDCDITLTNKIKAGGDTLDIQILDHIVFANETYFSFADRGML